MVLTIVNNVTSPDLLEKPIKMNNNLNNNNANNSNNNNNVTKDQLALIKSNLLNPTEVTFCDISDDDDGGSHKLMYGGEYRRKRLISNDSETDSIVSSTTTLPKKKNHIPDGGYGWVIVFSSFVVSLILDGISFSFGLLFSEFLAYFKESESKTAWIGALFLSVPLMSGPIMSNLVDTYGCRKMTMIGGLIGGTGFVLAAISNSVEMLCVTFGVIAGLGMGIGYVTAVVSIAFWFDKKRTFAVGIGASGTGIGTFLYAPLTQFLLEKFGWRGTTLILAGTLYNLCVCGALMRDPEWLIEENRLESRSQSVQTFSNSSVHLDEIKKLLDSGVKNEDVLETLVTNYNTEANQQIKVPSENELSKKYQSEMLLPTFNNQSQDFELGVSNNDRKGSWRSLRANKKSDGREILLSPGKLSVGHNRSPTTGSKLLKRNLASTESLNPSEKESFNDYETAFGGSSQSSLADCTRRFSLDESLFQPASDMNHSNFKLRGMSLDAIDESEVILQPTPSTVVQMSAESENKKKLRKRRGELELSGRNGNLRRNNTLQSHYFRNVVIHRNSINYRNAMLNTHRYRFRASSCPNIYRNSMTTIAREEEEKWYDNFIDIAKSAFDFSLFKDIKFFVFNMSSLLLFIWFIVPYFYITEHLLKNGYEESHGAVLISVIGLSQTFGMIALGWFGDRPDVNVAKVYGVCLVFCGISVGAMPFATHNYPVLLFLGAVFGITFASSFSFVPTILANLVDLDDFTCAYGLVLLVQGIGNLIGPPLASLIYGIFGYWDHSFYAAGFFIVIAGLLAYLTGVLQKRFDDSTMGGTSEVSSSTIEKGNCVNSTTLTHQV